MSQEPIITLLTDFGEEDPYVGAMKGVILRICPGAKLVDLSHQIQRHNIRQGAIFLFSLARYYPKNTIHLVVIDPGVGSERKAIIIQTKNYFFLGPDNGVLYLAAQSDDIQKVVEINKQEYMLQPISDTFHGRDIFAPIAAHLSKIERIEEFGAITQNYEKIVIPTATFDKTKISGEIIYIDRFGNLMTNISRSIYQEAFKTPQNSIEIRIRTQKVKLPVCSSYNEVEIGEFLAIFGSTDFLEISKNQMSAKNALDSQIEDKVILTIN